MSKAIDPEFEVGYVDVSKPGAFRELISAETEQRLREGEKLSVIGLTYGKYAAGAVAFHMEEEHVEIISLYVSPDFRRKGGGKILLSVIEKIAEELDSWVSVSFSAFDEESRTLEALFAAADYELRDDVDYRSYMVTLADCEDSEALKKAPRDNRLKYFSELSETKLKSYNKQAEAKLAPLPVGGLLSEALDRELSVAYEENGRVKGFVAIENMDYENGIRLAAAFNGTDNPMVLMWLVKAAFSVAEKKYDENTPLLIDVVDETADRFVRYVLPEVEVISRTYDKLV